MLAKSQPPKPPSVLQKIARAFRTFGWIGLAVQVCLAFLSVVSLLLATFGQNFSPDDNPGNSIGMFWAVASLIGLVVGLGLTSRYTLVGRALQLDPQVKMQPKKSDAIQLLRLGIMTGGIGMLLGLLGSGTSIGVIVGKTVSQPPGVAITDPEKIVRTLDALVMLANISLIAAHFAGVLTALWLLERIHYYEKPAKER